MPWHPFTLTIDTPCFLGQDPPDLERDNELHKRSFPVASLRGVLRYWFRALVGAHLDNTDDLYRVESQVFGRAGKRGQPDSDDQLVDDSQSAVLLRSTVPVTYLTPRRPPMWFGHDNVPYLLGLGLATHRGLNRGFLDPGTPVHLAVRVRNLSAGVPADAVGDLFLASLWAIRTFGGLGARTRRGFGGVSVTMPSELPHSAFRPEWITDDNPALLSDVLICVAAALTELGAATASPTSLPAFPCFRPGRYILGADRPLRTTDLGAALSVVGDLLQSFRREGEDATREWDEIVGPFLDGETVNFHSTLFENAALGLPVNFQKKDTQLKATVTVEDGRRASPLWLRLRPGTSGWTLRPLAFASEFLPGQAAAPETRLTMTKFEGRRRVGRPTPVHGPSQKQFETYLAAAVAHLGGP
jgi:hypothetical protein